jgi:hypothetical protein
LEKVGQKLTWDPERDRPTQPPRPSKPQTYTFERLLRECDRDGDRLVTNAEWIAGKPDWQWLFPVIDTDRNDTIDPNEYAAFQTYKSEHPDWQARLRRPDN